MTTKKVAAVRNPTTGSYTVPVPKSARTGRFVARSAKTGRIMVVPAPKKAS
ncbi:MAG TPA: hypothetical protein H9871_08405 [Candidatus Nesterenkonia stercoripullorum]|uniref:Uncharacterized protein n=1 Tax=Candidatus Nesterenkonia stercoripullorum TaxID=2838701 RepID=A0A9D1UTN0_9MICC|nr:hypothetical protein [Candidatus Nesterenkonia stercoripullorum]